MENKYDSCANEVDLNAAWGEDLERITDEKNVGDIDGTEATKRANAVDDAYGKRIHELWADEQRKADTKIITAAEALGFTSEAFSTPTAVQKAAKQYSDGLFAGLPKGGPQVEAAIAKANHVSEVLTTALAAYSRLHGKSQ